MPGGITVTRAGHTPEELMDRAGKCKCKVLARRLRAVARVLDGDWPRARIAAAARVDAQTLCDWVHRFNDGGPEALGNRARSGRPSRLTDVQKATVRAWLQDGAVRGSGRSAWTLATLRERIREVFKVVYTLSGVRCLVRGMGFRQVSPRPVHPRANPQAQEDFRRHFGELGTDPGTVDVWFEDEARIGQKGMLTRVWALKGTRPRVPRDHRYGYCCLFSSICPAAGAAVGHVCDRANTDEMNRHPADLSAAVPGGRHALVVLDGAGWHRSGDLEIPGNLSLLRLPPYSPELNPVERVFSFLKSRHFANRVFDSADHVRETVGSVWAAFANTPDRIASIGAREWARIT